jgi:hypothetical protein
MQLASKEKNPEKGGTCSKFKNPEKEPFQS